MDAEELFIIKEGVIQISKLSQDGKELTLRMSSKNDIVGELSIFSDHEKYMFNAYVLENGEVAVIKRQALEEEMEKNGKLAIEYMKWLSKHHRKTQTKFRDLILNGRKGALYSTLIRMTNSYGVIKEDGILIDMILTNQDLANFCGTTRESINRMLSELRKLNIVSINKGKILIHDVNYLRTEIGCEDCSIDLCNID